jgi:hypothetical protein
MTEKKEAAERVIKAARFLDTELREPDRAVAHDMTNQGPVFHVSPLPVSTPDHDVDVFGSVIQQLGDELRGVLQVGVEDRIEILRRPFEAPEYRGTEAAFVLSSNDAHAIEVGACSLGNPPSAVRRIVIDDDEFVLNSCHRFFTPFDHTLNVP